MIVLIFSPFSSVVAVKMKLSLKRIFYYYTTFFLGFHASQIALNAYKNLTMKSTKLDFFVIIVSFFKDIF
jgi:hypothetical protein